MGKMAADMTTRERIVEEALTLFSINGYKGTSVKNIADAVGIKDSSLYKHFKSKQEILDTIVETMRRHMEDMSDTFGLPSDDDLEEAASVYSGFDETMLVDFSKKIFLFYLKDSFMSRFWRMGNIEQYQNPEVSAVYRQLFLADSISYQTALFAEMIKEHIFTGEDAQVMAMYFYSPIFFLLSKYANEAEKEEEALGILEKQVREFYRIYRRR
ncbi:MAG: TetR/AcrR family transcriptional regulator [Lachnospiraceae bacterium]|nr:TetR/AcrR family transcriptional regulator [Lachnospiraceae bacterium]